MLRRGLGAGLPCLDVAAVTNRPVALDVLYRFCMIEGPVNDRGRADVDEDDSDELESDFGQALSAVRCHTKSKLVVSFGEWDGWVSAWGASALQLLGAVAFQVAMGRVTELVCTNVELDKLEGDDDGKFRGFLLVTLAKLFSKQFRLDFKRGTLEKCKMYDEDMIECYNKGPIGVFVCQLSWRGETDLLRAILAGQPADDLVNCAITAGCRGLGEEDQLGEFTPLHVAAYRGHVTTVDALLQVGARIDERAFDGSSPIFCAITQNHSAVVRTLLQHGCDVNSRIICEPGWQNRMPYRAGFTPLIMSVNCNLPEITALLLSQGHAIDPNVSSGPLDLRRLPIRAGRMLEVTEYEFRCAGRFTALHIASHLDLVAQAELLLAASTVAIDVRSLPGCMEEVAFPLDAEHIPHVDLCLNTPLHVAKRGSPVAQALLTRGACVLASNFALKLSGAQHAAHVTRLLPAREVLEILRVCMMHRVPTAVSHIILEHVLGLTLTDHLHHAVSVELGPGHWPLMALALSTHGQADALSPFHEEIDRAISLNRNHYVYFIGAAQCPATMPSPQLRALLTAKLEQSKKEGCAEMLAQWKAHMRGE
jgi:ankyrin repeat protein